MFKSLIKILICILLFLAIWKSVTVIFNLPAYLFPSPEKVFMALNNNLYKLLGHLQITLLEIVVGFIIANLLSVFLAFLTYSNPKLERVLIPLAVSAKTMPLIAVIPLILVWFGSGVLSKIFAVILICFFPALISMIRGIKSINCDVAELFDFYAASTVQKIRFLVIPSTSPYLFSALKISSSLAVIGALVSELIAANKGLGFVILTSYYTFDIPMVFAVVILTCLIGIVFYYLIQHFEHKIIYWTEPVD